MNNDEPPAPAPSTVAGFVTRAAGHVADALRYWEPRRAIYNAVLAALVLGHLFAGSPDSWTKLSVNVLLGFFFPAVLANVCYCAVYVVDLLCGSPAFVTWDKGRVVVLTVGTAFAAVIAHFLVANILGGEF